MSSVHLLSLSHRVNRTHLLPDFNRFSGKTLRCDTTAGTIQGFRPLFPETYLRIAAAYHPQCIVDILPRRIGREEILPEDVDGLMCIHTEGIVDEVIVTIGGRKLYIRPGLMVTYPGTPCIMHPFDSGPDGYVDLLYLSTRSPHNRQTR